MTVEALKNTPAPPAKVDYSDIAKGMPSDDPAPANVESAPKVEVVQAEAAEPKPGETQPEPKPGDTQEGEGVGTTFERGFKQLTQRSAALRAREDAVKPLEFLSKIIDPVKAQAFAKALQSNNPMSVMAALGFTYADIASSVAGGGNNPKNEAPPEVRPGQKAEAEVNPEIAEVLANYRAQKVQQQEQTVLTGIKGVVTAAGVKFKNIAGLEDFHGVSNVLAEMWAEGGNSFPSNDAAENITIAAEEYERRLVDGRVSLTKKQWEKLQGLTPLATSGSTPTVATRVRPGNAQVSSGTTLTNNAGAPPPAPAATRQDPAKMYSDIAAGMPT